MDKSEIEDTIRQLQEKKLGVFEVPKELENDMQIVAFERKAGLRITGKRGFDVISNSFFVEEQLIDIGGIGREKNIHLLFDDFNSYFNFLNGDIYNNSCYAFCVLSDEAISSRKIDLKKLMERKAFVEDTIDDYLLSISKKEKIRYDEAEQVHKQCQIWVGKFIECNNYEELVNVVNKYNESKLATIVDISFFLFQYIFADVENKKHFSAIMEYMSTGAYPQSKMINALCSIYDPDSVVQSFDYTLGTKGTRYKYKRKLKEYVCELKAGEIEFCSKAFFDKETHYFCEATYGYRKGRRACIRSKTYRYFENFEEFIEYRNRDLTYCDLSSAFELNADLSNCLINETTKLPSQLSEKVTYFIEKRYHNGKFHVMQRWNDIYGNAIKEYKHSFDYFFDFVAFLKGDLSEADLLLCDGLMYLKNWDFINFSGAKMKSSLCKKFGLEYEIYELKTNLIEAFAYAKENESNATLTLKKSRELSTEITKEDLSTCDTLYDERYQKVHYISDLHLMHRIQEADCRSKEDVIYTIQRIVISIANEAGDLLLINGDVASDFEIFQLFVEILSRTLRYTKVIFTLGNHELWSFPDLSINEIVMNYRLFLNRYGMYLLHNDIIFQNGDKGLSLIKFEELYGMSDAQIVENLRCARYVILGSLGFSGYNNEFNADNGIYRKTIDRTVEIKESKRFESLYNRLRYILSDKNTIILTHTPKADWCSDSKYDKNFVYVSGHTHRNVFYDDGTYRIYSDNQIGYYNNSPHLKSFLLDYDYDCFADYNDGIYEITREQYIDFYTGKNEAMTFQREINTLYMLKKKEYYCFIHESQEGSLTILNGGAMRKLEKHNVQYYYDNMEKMIAIIKRPLDKFTVFQKRIASLIKSIGGFGTIHGSIIDIDVYNHIYVNPIDLTITGYWASDMINKTVYPSVLDLLEKNCPEMFGKYAKILEENKEIFLSPQKQTNVVSLPHKYIDTDIYKASREIKKMQKLSSNILTFWNDDILSKMS